MTFKMDVFRNTSLWSRITTLVGVLKLFFYPMLSDFRKDITFWKVPKLCPFVFLGRASWEWRWLLYFFVGRKCARCWNSHRLCVQRGGNTDSQRNVYEWTETSKKSWKKYGWCRALGTCLKIKKPAGQPTNKSTHQADTHLCQHHFSH